VQQRIDTAILALAMEPRPRGVRKMQGGHDQYRIRVGDYRILYRIDDSQRRVLIVHIGHRRDVYR
jgi:mRNA interferase RelE/StbE